jgi:hypothetical protein
MHPLPDSALVARPDSPEARTPADSQQLYQDNRAEQSVVHLPHRLLWAVHQSWVQQEQVEVVQ